MCKKIMVVAGLCITLTAKAQQLVPQTINSGGNHKAAGAIVLEDALGGLLVSSISGSGFLYTQDFLQPDAGTTSSIPFINNVTLSSGNGIDNAGTTFIAGSTLLEFTVGEFASLTYVNANNMLTQGILQPYSSGSALPVSGLEFYAKRTGKNQVQLNWKTVQEISNRGFHIERKKENESDFRTIGFVSTAAAGGNSNQPLQYRYPDNNDFAGKTYYRLKQEDIDGRTLHSVIRWVNGESNQASMQIWPVPSTGPVSVLVTGIGKADQLHVYDMNGRLVQQQSIQDNIPVQLKPLLPGSYLLRLAGNKELSRRTVIQ